MNGIITYGAYIPYYRLKKETSSQAFGKAAGKGEKAVAYCDEDSITMAVAAAMDAMKGVAPASVAGVLFASATAPYQEKMNAAEVAAALDAPPKAAYCGFCRFSAGRLCCHACSFGCRAEDIGDYERLPPWRC